MCVCVLYTGYLLESSSYLLFYYMADIETSVHAMKAEMQMETQTTLTL